MLRVLLESRGDRIELPAGETTIGRDTTCRIRFNDGTVSRLHASIRVEANVVLVEDRNSSNGTLLNGQKLRGPRRLSDGDTIELGDRTIRVRIAERAGELSDEDDDVITHDRFSPPPGLLAAAASAVAARRESATIPRMDHRNCVSCRGVLGASDERCPHCGRMQNLPRFVAVTAEHRLPDRGRPDPTGSERRRELRRNVQIPVVFQSDVLTFEAFARDVSGSGMFVETDLLEPVGTECRVTLLADGAPAISLAAVVSRVVEQASGDAPAAGLGLSLRPMEFESELWLRRVIGRIDGTAQEDELRRSAQ